ncbi:polymer-forming cytoskeletal protein, partial [Patescibacteria group bacterium]|nr:polymer-forming cytoskeletal protein [Patescibacteria group bacterium]
MKSKIKYLIAFVAVIGLATIALAGSAQAQESRTGTNVIIAKDQLVDSSLTTSGDNINIEGNVNGDVFCVGGKVTISGRVNGSVYCAVQSLTVSGRIDGDIISFAQDFNLSGTVDGSITLLGQNITFDSAARVRRDVALVGANVITRGIISRDANINAGNATIDGIIGRNLSGNFGTLKLGSSADVRGKIDYASTNNLTRDGSSKTQGTITKTSVANANFGSSATSGIVALIVGFLLFFVSLLVVSLLTVWLFPRLYITTEKQLSDHFGKSLLLGGLNMLAAPLLCLLLLITIIGAPLSGLIFTAWVMSLMLSGPIAAYYVGSKLTKHKYKPFRTMLVGSVVVLGLYAVPIVNILVGLTVGVLGSGALVGILG